MRWFRLNNIVDQYRNLQFMKKVTPPSRCLTAQTFNNRNTRKRCNICSKLTIKTTERRQWQQRKQRNVFFTLTSFVQAPFTWYLHNCRRADALRDVLSTLSNICQGSFFQK